jgi:hypothetical protein
MEVRARAKMMMAIRVSRRESPLAFLRLLLRMEGLSVENEAEYFMQIGPVPEKRGRTSSPF